MSFSKLFANVFKNNPVPVEVRKETIPKEKKPVEYQWKIGHGREFLAEGAASLELQNKELFKLINESPVRFLSDEEREEIQRKKNEEYQLRMEEIRKKSKELKKDEVVDSIGNKISTVLIDDSVENVILNSIDFSKEDNKV